MKNLGLSNYATLITKQFNDVATTYINPIPEFWNVHVLTPLYQSRYHNGLTFSLISNIQESVIDIGLGKGIRFSEYLELEYVSKNIVLKKSDGSKLMYEYKNTISDQSYTIEYYENKETNSTISAINDRYGMRWRLVAHNKDSYEFNANYSKILLKSLVRYNRESIYYKYDNKNRIIEISNNAKKVEKLTIDYSSDDIVIRAYKTNISNVFEEVKYIKITLNTNPNFNGHIKEIVIKPNTSSPIKQKHIEYGYSVVGDGFVTYKITNLLSNLYVQFEVSPSLKPNYYQDELGRITRVVNDNPYCAKIIDYRGNSKVYHSDAEGNLTCVSDGSKGVVSSTLYDELHREHVVSNVISYNPEFNGEVIEPIRIYCNNMYATRELIATPVFLSAYYKESKCWRLNILNKSGKYYQVYEVEGSKYDVYSLGMWLYLKDYSSQNTSLAVNIYLTNNTDKYYIDNVAMSYSIKVKAKYIPADYEYYMTMVYAKEAYKYIVVEVEETDGEELTCEFVIDLYKNGLAILNEFDENNNIIEKINGNNVKEYVYNIDNTLSSSVSVNYEYDHHGNIIKNVDGYGTENLYKYDDSNNLLRYEMKNGEKSIIAETKYLDEEVVKNVNTINGIDTHFEFTPVYILKEETMPNKNNKTLYNEYEYNGADYELLKKKTYLKEDKEPVNDISYDYDEARLLTTIDCNYNTMTYKNVYDEYLRLTNFKVNGNSFVSYTYETYNGYKTDLIKTKQLGNKDLYEYNYDRYGRLIDVYYKESINSNASLMYEYTYDELDRIIKIEDKATEMIYKFDYDSDRNLAAYYLKIDDGVYVSIAEYNLKINEIYDKDQRLILTKYNIEGETFNTSTQSIFREYTNSFDYYKYQIRNTKDLLLCMFDDLYLKDKIIDPESANKDESEYPETRLLLINNSFQYKAINSNEDNKYCKLDGMLNYYESNGNNPIVFDFLIDNILGTNQSIAMSFKAIGSQSAAKLISVVDETHELNVIINSDNKISIQYVSNNATTTLFTTSYSVVDNEYHFMCLTYDVDNHKIILKINGRSNEITFNKELDRILGLDFVIGFKGEITNIIIPKENIISDEDYENYFKSFNLLLAINKSRKEDNEIIKVSSKEILPDLGNQTFIPLNNGTAGIKENEVIYPIYDDVVNLPCIGSANTEFVFNSGIKKYAYYAMGQRLVYKTDLSDTGTITLRYNLLHKDEENILFELKDKNNHSMTLSIKDSIFVLKVGTLPYTFKPNEKNDELNTWNTITLSWNRMVSSASLATTSYYVNIFHNGKKLNMNNYSVTSLGIFEALNLNVGRNSNYEDKYGNCFNGLIESIVYSNKFLTEDSNYEKINNVDVIYHKYDSMNLLKERVVVNEGKEVLTNKYSYVKLDSETNRMCLLVSEENIKGVNYSYSYDARGNIIGISKNNEVIAKYEYDNLGRLIYEDNNGSISKYSIDSNGNILAIHDDKGKLLHTYKYDKGLLVEFDGTRIEYDSANTLNPLKIGDNITLSYECRNLVAYDDNVKHIHNKYWYNQNKLRIKKEVFNEYGDSLDTIHYYYDMNNKLIHQRTRDYEITFLYDELGELYGLMYNGFKYYYVKDILGTIKGITYPSGNVVVSYEYDAWGNITKISDYSGIDLGTINPFRYKCYYYDSDINMYYCQSRYYVVEWKRWLNADNPDYLSQEDINNLNLFVYCGNNPVMYSDESGNIWKWLAVALAVVAVIVVAIIVNHVINGIECAVASKEIEKEYFDENKDTFTIEEATAAIEKITGKGTVHFGTNAVKIDNSYNIKSRYERIYISKIIQKTVDDDGNYITDRSTYSLSAEWFGHNAHYFIFKDTASQDVDLDYDFNTNAKSTKNWTKVLMIIGLL